MPATRLWLSWRRTTHIAHVGNRLNQIIVTPLPDPTNPVRGSVLPVKQAEELLRSLQEVVSARIVTDPFGGIEVIHLLVTGESMMPKQIVRNVESALMAHLGMRVDHRKISVATTVKRPASPLSTPVVPPSLATAAAIATVAREGELTATQPALEPTVHRRGLYFVDVEIRGSRQRGVACKVTLRRGEEVYVGEAEGYESDKSRVELSARATLAAIQLGESELNLSLEGAKVIQAFDRELVLVGVVVRRGRDSTLLTGSCEVRDSVETASSLAVLNATNRWVEAEK